MQVDTRRTEQCLRFLFPRHLPVSILDFPFLDQMILEQDFFLKRVNSFFHPWIKLVMLTIGQFVREDTEGKENSSTKEELKASAVSRQSLSVLFIQQIQINHAHSLELKDNIQHQRGQILYCMSTYL